LEQLAEESAEVPAIFTVILQVILVLGLIGVIVAIFYLATRGRRKRRALLEEEVIETRETVLSADLLRDQLQDLLNSLRRPRAPPIFLDLSSADDPRRVIRELYQRVLQRAIDLSLPRRRGQTPETYRGTLSDLCPGEDGDLETLTDAYVVARYGTKPPEQEQVQSAQQAFQRVHSAMRRPDGLGPLPRGDGEAG